MVRSVLFLKPVSGGFAAIERFFEEEGVLERSARVPGFLGGELQRPEREDAPALVTALWERPEDYRTWVEDPWRAERAQKAATVFTSMAGPDGAGSLYEVTLAVGPALPGRSEEPER